MTHRAIYIQETGEEVVGYDGTREECQKWINDNREDYPEARGFYVEEKREFRDAQEDFDNGYVDDGWD